MHSRVVIIKRAFWFKGHIFKAGEVYCLLKTEKGLAYLTNNRKWYVIGVPVEFVQVLAKATWCRLRDLGKIKSIDRTEGPLAVLF